MLLLLNTPEVIPLLLCYSSVQTWDDEIHIFEELSCLFCLYLFTSFFSSVSTRSRMVNNHWRVVCTDPARWKPLQIAFSRGFSSLLLICLIIICWRWQMDAIKHNFISFSYYRSRLTKYHFHMWQMSWRDFMNQLLSPIWRNLSRWMLVLRGFRSSIGPEDGKVWWTSTRVSCAELYSERNSQSDYNEGVLSVWRQYQK